MNQYKKVELNSGRNCLKYIIRAYKIKEIYIPHYICPAIRSSIYNEGCKIVYYHINDKFEPELNFKQFDYILYANYWGICNETVKKLSNKYPNLIVDNAHSFYSNPLGIASFNSLRKFFPLIQDGAILYTAKTLETNIQQDNFDYEPENLTQEQIYKNEDRINNLEIMYMSEKSKKLIKKYNTNEKMKERYNKFLFFHDKYNNKNQLKIDLSEQYIPYSYPYLAENIEIADREVKELESLGYTIYRFWNNLPKKYNEYKFYTRLININLSE